jgi:hypothetical protein
MRRRLSDEAEVAIAALVGLAWGVAVLGLLDYLGLVRI